MKKKSIVISLSICLVAALSALLMCIGCKQSVSPSSASVGEVTEESEVKTIEEGEEVVIQQYEWQTSAGTFKISERIANKVAKGERLVIKVSTWDPTAPFFVEMKEGVLKAGEDLGVETELIGPPEATADKQIAELETLIKSEAIDGLAIDNSAPDIMIPIYDLAWEKGIPVVTVDNDAETPKRLCYIGIKQEDVGKANAEVLMKLTDKKSGKLLYYAAYPEAMYAIGRFNGFFGELEKNGYNFEKIGPFSCGIDMNKAYAIVEDAFLSNPDIEFIFGADEFCQGAAEYVLRNNLNEKVMVFGVNTMREILEYIKKGALKSTVGQNPPMQGYKAVEILYNFITKGETADEKVFIETVTITSENVDEFLK